MSRRKLTDEEKAARLERRAAARAAAQDKLVEQHTWWQDRARAARRRYDKAMARRAKARAKAAKKDRSPKVTVTPYAEAYKQTTAKLGEAVVHGRRVTGNHEYRRAVGQRSHYGRDVLGTPGPKPRRRDMPGAVAKRIARNKGRWAA